MRAKSQLTVLCHQEERGYAPWRWFRSRKLLPTHTSSVLQVETRRSKSRVEGGVCVCARVKFEPILLFLSEAALVPPWTGRWPRSLVPMSLPQSSLTRLPRAHRRYYHKAGTKSNNYPTCTTVLSSGTWSHSGPAFSSRQTSPAGSFAVCAAPVFGSIALRGFNRKPAEHSFQFCITRCTTVFLIGYITINTANKRKKQSLWSPKRGSQLKWDKDYFKWWHEPQKKTCLSNERSSF